jgi:NADPH:quinone reductase-like Zn-dependent oxidoreductase
LEGVVFSMKVYELHGFGLENLRLAERPVPEPGPGELLIRMRAAALNPRDLGVIDGFYFPDLEFPVIPVSDGDGEVVGIGPGVRRFRVGDRVAGTFARGGSPAIRSPAGIPAASARSWTACSRNTSSSRKSASSAYRRI